MSPEYGEGFYWGVGPVLYYPSATNSALGVNKWGSGPSAAFVIKDESRWVFGGVVNNIWSFGGPPGSSDRTNQLFLNPFVNYNFDDGWSIGSSPEITANWIASGGKWTVPVGGGFGKAFQFGGQPMRLDLDAYYNAIRPKAGNETWQLGHNESAMRTNIEIDDELIREALRVSGLKTKRAAVEAGLRALIRLNTIRLNRRKKILDLAGKIHWEGNLNESREGRFLP